MNAPLLDVDDIELALLLEAIRMRYGYDMREYTKATLRRRVEAVMGKLEMRDYGELQRAVLRDRAVFAKVLSELTVHVSDLFRDPAFFLEFRERVVPHLKPYSQIRIWHAGCSTGEEAYSSAIVLDECGLLERSQIYATDLGGQALQHGREGVFPIDRLPAYSRAYEQSGGRKRFADYYTTAYGHLAFDERLKRNLFFFEHNLVSDHAFGEMQVVFCRNVMIYFDEPLRGRVLAKFEQALCHGGFLALGRSERLPLSVVGGKFEEFAPAQGIYRYWGTT